MEVKDALIAARKLIDDAPRLGRDCYEHNGCFCTVGAITKVLHPSVKSPVDRKTFEESYSYHMSNNDVQKVLNVIIKVMGFKYFNDIMDYNDTHTKQEVLAVFDKTIESCPS